VLKAASILPRLQIQYACQAAVICANESVSFLSNFISFYLTVIIHEKWRSTLKRHLPGNSSLL
jgi:hypothetical protein